MLEILSSGIKQIPHLNSFIKEELEKYDDPAETQAVAGWGHKLTASDAIAKAQQLGVKYIALEDGFIRSFGLGGSDSHQVSMSVDPYGVYYDARTESLIERLLRDDSWFNNMMLMRVQNLVRTIAELEISKYNKVLPCTLETKGGNNLLILDQTADDASLEQGLAPKNMQELMENLIRQQYPNYNVYLKMHPDVIAKKKKGVIDHKRMGRNLRKNVSLIDQNFNPVGLLKRFDAVFTATSQMGFEALMLGKKVHCFGMPFYAGYGLTQDEVDSPRRREILGVTMEKLFAAAYLGLCRYVNPITGKRTEIEEILELLALQRDNYYQDNRNFVVLNATKWKKKIYQGYLSNAKEVFYADNQQKALELAAEHNATLVQWASSQAGSDFALHAREHDVDLLFIEDGFLRSNGLGTELIKPYSLVFDTRGIYYDPTKPSDLEVILNRIKERFDLKHLKQRAKELREYIVEKTITKYNVEGGKAQQDIVSRLKSQKGIRKVILVPGQVATDASVKEGGAGIGSNLGLVKLVREKNPQAFIVYKTHPDIVSRNRAADRDEGQIKTVCDLMVRDVNISVLFDLVDEVHVLSSLSGFEALMRQKRVVVYGRPFYAGWGLTRDFQEFDRRRTRLDLDELVVGALILYPRYYDWNTGLFCRAEDICFNLENLSQPLERPWLVTVLNKIFRLRKAI